MESTRQKWRIYAIATIALIVIILLSTTVVKIQFQVCSKAQYPLPPKKKYHMLTNIEALH